MPNPLFIDRKATVIPYLEKCKLMKEEYPFILRKILIPKLTTLGSNVKENKVVQDLLKFVMVTSEKIVESNFKIVLDQALLSSFLVGRIGVSIFCLDKQWGSLLP